MKEAQLKVDKEQLEIETELAASAARLKIYLQIMNHLNNSLVPLQCHSQFSNTMMKVNTGMKHHRLD